MASKREQAFKCHEHEDLDNIPDCFLCSDLAQGSRNEDNASGRSNRRPALHWALSQSRLQGQRPFRDSNLEMLSISSRRKSFEQKSTGKTETEGKENKLITTKEGAQARDNQDGRLASGETKVETGFENAITSPRATTAAAPSSDGSCAEADPLWLGPCRDTMSMAGFYRLAPDRARCSYCDLELRKLRASDDVWMRHKHMSPCCRRLRQIGDAGIRETPKGKKRLRHSFSSYYDLTR